MRLSVLLLTALVCMMLTCNASPAFEAKDFLEGFFNGTLRDKSVDINECIDDGTDIIEDVEKLVKDITGDLIDNLEEVFLDLIDILADIPPAVVECEKVPDEISKYQDWIKDLENPTKMKIKFMQAFFLYAKDIKADVQECIESFSAEDYKTAGYDVGDLLYIVFERTILKMNEVLEEDIKN